MLALIIVKHKHLGKLLLRIEGIVFYRDWVLTFAVCILVFNDRRDMSEISYHLVIIGWIRARNWIRRNLITIQIFDLWSLIVISWWNLLITTGIINSHEMILLFQSIGSYVKLVILKLIWLSILRSLHVNWMQWVWNIVFSNTPTCFLLYGIVKLRYLTTYCSSMIINFIIDFLHCI